MGYQHINNLYKDQRVLLFKECYALEKIHGTSAHISWKAGQLHFSSGGEKHERFKALFDEGKLITRFQELGHEAITIYGEAYGGSQQAQKWRYGEQLRFVAFEVQIGEHWLDVPTAHEVVTSFGLEFVYYKRVATDITFLDAERDAPSEQAKRNGVEGDKPREGVVLRPLIEMRTNSGERIVAKHKRDEERETTTPRKVVDPTRLQVLDDAQRIADEWVTPTRLEHVLDKLPQNIGMEQMRDILAAMVEDVLREGAGEIIDSREARAAISKKTAQLFKERLKKALL